MRTSIVAVAIVGMAGLPSPALARETYFNDFREGLGAGLTNRGYYLEDGGSYSTLSALQLEVTNHEVVIAGDGNGAFQGWLGQSLTHDASGARGVISVESDVTLSEFVSGGGGFQLTLLIELTPRDRIMFSYVLPEPGRDRQSELTIDEGGGLRFTPRKLIAPNGTVFHMKLELDSATKMVRAWVNRELWQEDTFQGTTTGDARIGIAATVRWQGDQLIGRFDNLGISFDRAFLRAEVNGDGSVDISDAVTILNYLFTDTGDVRCLRAADVDDNGELQITDAIRLLLVLFLDAPPIPVPTMACGLDATGDELPCAESVCSG